MDVGDDVLAGAAIFPFCGTGKAIWEIRILAGLLEELSNATFEAIEEVTLEMTAMRTMVLQNHMALDFVLASKGGTCALIGEERCTYIPDNQPEIRSHLKLTEEVAQKAQIEKETWFSRLSGSISSWGGKLMQLILVIAGILGCTSLVIFVKCGTECVRRQTVQVLAVDQMHQVQDVVRLMKYSVPMKLDNIH
ncbi:endogenous retrovirus group PABLB member 1 Env polyprotein-like [Protopterus annectens]|uniref:endogenous retrovirus group PABLB member 1 Env polyprotein-like n=1 Tax=Protopterus annectens TaxID=7888 RepID=UPI001CFC19B8|nr:endogenous retrovirus group PABLB member 1 Env polyprotein-like [Protopterus annectens]